MKSKKMKSACWKPTQCCLTVGEIKKALEDIPDDTPVKGSNILLERKVIIRYKEEEVSCKKWIAISTSAL